MKRFLFLLIFIPVFGFSQYIAIPDENFEKILIEIGYDKGTPDGFVPTVNISSIDSLDINSQNISDLTGIEAFTDLRVFGLLLQQTYIFRFK